MRLARLLRISYPLLQDLLRFLYILSVQVDGVACDFPDCIILPEDEFGCLLVITIGCCSVLLALLAEIVGACTVATLVCFSRLRGEMLVLTLFFAG